MNTAKSDVEPAEAIGTVSQSDSPQSHPDMEKESESQQAVSSPRTVRGIAWVLLCAAVFSSQFLFALDNTIVADVQPGIIEDLGEIQKLPWITVAFELAAVSANLFWGKVYGLFDNKVLFTVSVLLFEVGSALCGAAPNTNILIVGRVICGLGGNGIFIGVMNFTSTFTTLKERPLYVSYAGAAWCVGIILGPIIGGAFTDSSASWRWAFYINICIGGVMLPTYLFLLPSHKPLPQVRTLEKLKRVDFLGLLLFVGAFTSGILAISFGGIIYTWNSGPIIGLFVCSGVLWSLSGVQQTFFMTRERRLFPTHFLKSRDMWILFAQTSSSIALLFLELFFVPLYLQFIRSDNALIAGTRMLPLIFVGLFFSILGGGVLGKFGWYMPWYLLGSALALIGAALMRTIGVDTSLSYLYGYTVLLAAGIGSFVQTSFSVAQAKIPSAEKSESVAFIACAQLSGLAISFSVAYSIFVNTAANQIADLIPAASIEDVQTMISGVNSQFFAALMPVQKVQILEVINNSVVNVYDQMLAGAAFSLVLALFMKWERLDLEG